MRALHDARDRDPLPSLREVRQALHEVAGDALVDDPRPIELSLPADRDPPRIAAAAVIEGPSLARHSVEGEPEVAFTAFLDGTQDSRTIAYADGFPIVVATVGAVIRARQERRFSTWDHRVQRRLYAPMQLLPRRWTDRLLATRLDVRDTLDGSFDAGEPTHPFVLAESALHAVQRDREREERELAEAWCRRETGPLFIDGGTAGIAAVAADPRAVGVVKSHRVLYGGGEMYGLLLALRRAERSSVVRVDSGHGGRSPVASWYLRLRDAAGHDPFWSLVRVETSLDFARAGESVGDAADRVSRWILAELAPIALPDARWDKMMYGIRDCEQFLKAVMG